MAYLYLPREWLLYRDGSWRLTEPKKGNDTIGIQQTEIDIMIRNFELLYDELSCGIGLYFV